LFISPQGQSQNYPLCLLQLEIFNLVLEVTIIGEIATIISANTAITTTVTVPAQVSEILIFVKGYLQASCYG